MATVSEIMTREVTALDVEISLRDALEVLRAENVSGAPVLSGQRVVGVVSLTDIVEYVTTSPGVPARREVETDWDDYQPPDVWEEGTDSPSSFFADYWSDAGADVAVRFEEPESPEWDLLATTAVSQVATRAIVAVGTDTEVAEAARMMTEASVHRLLVLDGNDLAGIVSATDIVRAVAQRVV